MRFEKLTALGQSALAVARGGRSELPDALRREIARGAIRLNLPFPPTLPNPIALMGYRISYFRTEELRYLFWEIFTNSSYFFRADADRPRIVDCGSNIGMSILFFKKLYPNARIIGFEPDPATFETLEANVRQNHLTDVALNCVALSDRDGVIEFYRGEQEKGSLRMSVHRERTADGNIPVPARRLSSFLTGEKIDLLKMDIEGAEHAVLGELAACGKLALVRQLHLEYHHHLVRGSDRLAEFLSLLERAGFGYQLEARPPRWGLPDTVQDVAIYGYRKD